MTKIKRRCLSGFLGLLNWLAALACLSAYQIWIGEYEKSQDEYDDRDSVEKKALFWSKINVIVQSIFLSLVNVMFELVFEALTHYESWEIRTYQTIRLFARLTDLEFFATAIQVPVMLALFLPYTRIFCVISPDLVANNEGVFDDNWYTTNGIGIFI